MTLRPTVLLAIALLALIIMMILPMPAIVLDIGLAVSFALAILVFTTTLFIERPLDFSSFPSVLLASLMLRLSLNVSSTKLIIGQGHTGPHAAGDVIEGFANFVMGGSVFMGLVVFGVLLIVNFIVITKGATRMAEVGARFALDGMPGKQLAIDSDMSAGAIDHAEAKSRRETEQSETTFFGSLDGASKFVKGDAIAGLLITLLNLVMGLAIGTIVHGMNVGTAFETYAILTVGDGLTNQIPAVIISIASALLLARGGMSGTTDFAVFSQLGRQPEALATVAGLMMIFAVFPGLPFLPFLGGAVLLGGVAYRLHRTRNAAPADAETGTLPAAVEPTMGDIIDLDEIHVVFATNLVPMVVHESAGLEQRIRNIRQHVATTYGLILPEVRLTDDATLPRGRYVIRVQGVEQASDRLQPDMRLALLSDEAEALPAGEDVAEPVYGAPARWLVSDDADVAALRGATIVAPAEVLATHLLEVIKQNFGRLFGTRNLRRLLDELTSLSDPQKGEANRRLFDDLIPDKVPMDLLVGTLRLLLEERVSIRNLPLIVEAVAEARPFAASTAEVCEYVRQKIAFQLTASLRNDEGRVPLVQLAPEWEETFAEHSAEPHSEIALPPDIFSKLATNISDSLGAASSAGHFPGLVTSVRRRRYLKTVLAAKGLTNPVLSFEELGEERAPSVVGVVAA